MVRMNLNTFARHGVFEIDGIAERIAAKLVDRDAIQRARVFPYQLMVAYQSLERKVPGVIREALQDADAKAGLSAMSSDILAHTSGVPENPTNVAAEKVHTLGAWADSVTEQAV